MSQTFVVVSTKSLLENLLKQAAHDFPFLCLDGTFKLNKNGYPLLMMNTIDRHYHGHPVANALCNGETQDNYEFLLKSLKKSIDQIYDYQIHPRFILADGSSSIRAAFLFYHFSKFYNDTVFISF